jgi:hypothetical protein
MIDKKRKKPTRTIQQYELPFKLRATEMRKQHEEIRNQMSGVSALESKSGHNRTYLSNSEPKKAVSSSEKLWVVCLQ